MAKHFREDDYAMERKVCVVLLVVVFISGAIAAGVKSSITGTVTGMPGKSVVYVEAIAGKTFPAPAKHATVDQKGLLFVPHILAVQQGTTVDFRNSDNVQHNIFWPSVGGDKTLGYNLGTWGIGGERSFKFDTPGVVPLLCNVHPEMAAFIIVTPTPYSAITDADGNYIIKDLPDGSYTVTVWHEGARSTSQQVQVAGKAKVDFTLRKKNF